MKQEIERLREEIRGHEYRYYVENAPTISDQEFDALMHQLIKLEAENPDCFDPNSPTQRVGSEVISNLTKVQHEEEMLSLDKTKEPLKLKSFLEKGVRGKKLFSKRFFPRIKFFN